MSDEERARTFEQAVRLLMQQYGMEFAAQIQIEQLGPAILSKPALVIQPIQGWTQPEPIKQAQDSPNEKVEHVEAP